MNIIYVLINWHKPSIPNRNTNLQLIWKINKKMHVGSRKYNILAINVW
jgi:hypothetical protein